MNVSETIREIQRRTPLPPTRRVAHGVWIEPAWVVRGLVENDWGVSDAVRQVVAEQKYHPADVAFKGIRAAYYVIRNHPWPI